MVKTTDSNAVQRFVDTACKVHKKLSVAFDEDESAALHAPRRIRRHVASPSRVRDVLNRWRPFQTDDPVEAAYLAARESARDRDVPLVDELHDAFQAAVSGILDGKLNADARDRFMGAAVRLQQVEPQSALPPVPPSVPVAPLSEPQANTLRILLKRYPECRTQEQIAGEPDAPSERTLSPILTDFRAGGLTYRPHGEKRGEQLTPAGLQIASSLLPVEKPGNKSRVT